MLIKQKKNVSPTISIIDYVISTKDATYSRISDLVKYVFKDIFYSEWTMIQKMTDR